MNQINHSKKAIIIDGFSLIYRAYFATLYKLDYFKKHNLKTTNALEMIIMMISKLLKRTHYDYGLVALDVSRKSFRTDLFNNYKANRKPIPKLLEQQIPLILKALYFFNLPILSLENYEADDLIGTFATICQNNKISCDIYSSDHDLLQLVDDYINVCLIKTGTSNIQVYNKDNFAALNHQLSPAQFVDYKAIVGDLSDNYKGVMGLGKISAQKLILEYHSIENLFINIEKLPLKIAKKLNNCKSDILLFKKLASIKKDLIISKEINDYLIVNDSSKWIFNLDDFLASNNILKYKKYFF